MPNLWRRFADVSSEQPSAAALLLGPDAVSFADLALLAERFAARLHEQGLRRGDVVALQLPKSKEAYALLLACLRQGIPYVFVDPKNPSERTASILARLTPRLFFSTVETKNPHGEAVHAAGDWNERWLCAGAGHSAPPPEPVSGTHPAYIMFTSGSTGEPKGAVIPHQGISSLMRWGRSLMPDIRAQRFTAINPLHFDNSVFDTYCGLLNGATLIPIETGEVTNPAAWTKAIRRAEASVMFAVPTLFLILDSVGLLTPEALPTVRLFSFGGEGFPVERLKEFHDRFAGHARLLNVYGPTETSCICSSHEIDAKALDLSGSKFPSLGRMHEDFEHLILDGAQAPAAPGTAGELWIGGPCVGLGYYRNPEETEARFRQGPLQNAYRSIWYRTGDLVMEDGDGLLWFRGRADNQVKVRGHRIELEEIDLAVQSVPGVSRAVSVVVTGAETDELHVVYVADREISTEEISQRCKERLPAYMRPHHVWQREALPLNANGKVDRRAIRASLQNPASRK
jgi:D-alanine--poly(phosphoribitol) ligase subunit 1